MGVSLNDEEVPYTVSLDLSRRMQSSNVNLYLIKVRPAVGRMRVKYQYVSCIYKVFAVGGRW